MGTQVAKKIVVINSYPQRNFKVKDENINKSITYNFFELSKISIEKYIEIAIGKNQVKGTQNKFLAKTTIQGLRIKTNPKIIADIIEKSLLIVRVINATTKDKSALTMEWYKLRLSKPKLYSL